MKKIILIVFTSTAYIVFGQDSLQKKDVSGELLYEHSFDLEGRPQTGLSFSIGLGIVKTENTQLNFRIGYRYQNLMTRNYGFFGPVSPTFDRSSFNGGVLGFEFVAGKKHQFHAATLFDIGGIVDHGFSGSFNPRIGYQYKSDKNFYIKAGAQAFLGRRSHTGFSAGYFVGIGGYIPSIKPLYVNKPRLVKNEKVGYFAIQSNFMFGSSGYMVMGANVQFDHLLYTSDAIDLGYSVGTSIGFVDDYFQSVRAAFIMLVGRGQVQFEYSLGPNFVVTDFNSSSPFDFVHTGIAFRVTGNRIPAFVRVGASTTAWVHIGTGFVIGTKRNDDFKMYPDLGFPSPSDMPRRPRRPRPPGFPHR